MRNLLTMAEGIEWMRKAIEVRMDRERKKNGR